VTRKASDADFRDAVQRYLSGEQTQSEAAASIGIRQTSFSDRLRRARIAGPNRAEAARRRAARMTVEERAALADSAHEAVRGMTRTADDLAKRALGKQRTMSHATDEERAVAAAVLGLSGVRPVLQQAVGKYNLDLGVADAVAVELFGGNWHSHGRHLARLPQRVEDIADAGWNLLIVWSRNGFRPEPGPVAQDVVAYLERTRSDPTFRRQYRVIRGDGEFIAAGCVDDGEVTLVPAGVRGVDARRR